jgi:alpha-tubulin suppressor-like RCC1 family protein
LSSGITDCWGNNGDGELGNGTIADAANPGAVYSSGTTPLANVSQLSPGMYFTCGVLASGTMDCWGDNNSGQLGVGGIALSETPIAVVGLP